MSQGFGGTNKVVEERDRARRQLELVQKENHLLRKLLLEIRPVLVTKKHKQAIDKALRKRPS
jgi:hypothetical protein